MLTDASGLRLYCACLTSYRQEEEEEEEEEGEGSAGGRGVGSGAGSRAGAGAGEGDEVTWWPTVLFLITRFPVVPQLQRVRRAAHPHPPTA